MSGDPRGDLLERDLRRLLGAALEPPAPPLPRARIEGMLEEVAGGSFPGWAIVCLVIGLGLLAVAGLAALPDRSLAAALALAAPAANLALGLLVALGFIVGGRSRA